MIEQKPFNSYAIFSNWLLGSRFWSKKPPWLKFSVKISSSTIIFFEKNFGSNSEFSAILVFNAKIILLAKFFWKTENWKSAYGKCASSRAMSETLSNSLNQQVNY